MRKERVPVPVFYQWVKSGEPVNALILLLDGKDTFMEVSSNSHKIFEKKLTKWKALELPILKRSNYSLWMVKSSVLWKKL